MDFRLNPGRIFSKKVWWVRGEHFVSDKGTRNGQTKAFSWCDEHGVNRKEVIQFDSETEWMRFEYLKRLEEREEVKNIQVHRPFVLVPATMLHSEMTYEADFVYLQNGRTIVEDVKPWFHLEDVFLVKWKLFDYQNSGNLHLSVVMKKPFERWFLNKEAWLVYTEGMRRPVNPNKKAALEEYREMKRRKRRVEKEKEKYLKLKALEHPTLAQKSRMVILEASLREAGVLIN